ncbi:MAG: Sec-independent protein translocase protein TatB, partial [Pseudomonadota bacterium]
MLDIGWAELLVVGVVALLVVGPKELPGMLRTLGKYLGMVRRQANEFK